VLIRDGKFAEVGKTVNAPADAIVIDATGKHVIPGIIDSHSHIAIEGSVNEGSLAVTSMTDINDVIDPTDRSIYLDLAGGVTTSFILHGSANPIGGQTAAIKLRWNKSAQEMLFQGAKPGLKFALGENVKRSGTPTTPGQSRRYPATRMGTEDVIRQAFVDAREYQRHWDEYDRRVKAGEKNVIPPERDLKLEPLVQVLRGERLIHAHSYRADETVMLMNVCNEFGIKIATFIHIFEGYKVAKEIAAHGAGASTSSDWWAYKMEAYDAIPQNTAIMMKKGVLVSLNSDSAEVARHLNQEAGKMMKYGLSENDALKLITINPAIQLQMDKRVGSIEPGKDADLVIYNNPPLSIFALVEKVVIDGQVYFDREKDMAQRKEIEKQKEALKKGGK
jgi:imidazolonepropionase-like amidohydrolase